MGRGDHVDDGLEVRLERPPPLRESTGVAGRPEPEGETLLLIGVNRAPESAFVRPVVRFVHGGWVPPSLLDGPQLLGPGQSCTFRVTLPQRPANGVGLQRVTPATPRGRRWRPGSVTLAPWHAGSSHPLDLDELGIYTVGALLYAFAVRGLTQWLFDFGIGALWVVAVAGTILVVLYAMSTHFYRRLKVWSREGIPPSSSAARTAELVIMTCAITYLLVAVTALLMSYGLLEASPEPSNGVDAVEGLERYFGVSLLGSIPVLHIPETFGLTAPVQYDGAAMGWIITAYRLILLVPAATLLVSLFNDVRFWPTRAGQAEVVTIDASDAE